MPSGVRTWTSCLPKIRERAGALSGSRGLKGTSVIGGASLVSFHAHRTTSGLLLRPIPGRRHRPRAPLLPSQMRTGRGPVAREPVIGPDLEDPVAFGTQRPHHHSPPNNPRGLAGTTNST